LAAVCAHGMRPGRSVHVPPLTSRLTPPALCAAIERQGMRSQNAPLLVCARIRCTVFEDGVSGYLPFEA
jgi:hypothetical protein